jgi:hypothetical protein
MSVAVRAEHESLSAFLEATLTPDQRARVLVTSFNQWDFALSAVAEVALTLHELNSSVTMAMWADELPLPDIGWMASRRIAHLCGTSTLDEAYARALIKAGIPAAAFVPPPVRKWKPAEDITIERPMNRSAIRQLRYRGSELGRALLQVHPDSNTPVTDDHYWPQRWLQVAVRSYAFVFDQVQRLIDRDGITAVLVFNGRFLNDRAAAAAAEARGIPVLYHDSGGADTDFDLTIEPTHDWVALQRRMTRLYDSWDPSERDQLGSEWFERRVHHTDPSNIPFVESQRLGASIEIDDGKRLIAFFSSSGDEIIELDLDWSRYFHGQENALALLAEICRELPETALVVRSHPHKRLKPRQDLIDWTAAVSAAGPDLHLDPFSPIDSYELMRQADVVVTYGSTTGIEAAYAGKPTIVMGPSAYDVLDCAWVVSTREELVQALREVTPPDPKGSLSWGLMMMRRGFLLRKVVGQPNERSISGYSVRPPRQLAVTLSHFLAVRRSRWLLKR